MRSMEAHIPAENREAWRAYRLQLWEDRDTVERIYREDRAAGATPNHTVTRCLERMSLQRVTVILASAVNRIADYDGRISRTVAAWAAAQPEAGDADAAGRLSLYCNSIHPAHLDQLAAELMRR